MLLLRERAEPPRRVRLQREADRRPVELVERLLRAAQVVAGERRRALDDVEERACRTRSRSALPGSTSRSAAARCCRRASAASRLANGPCSTSVSRSCAVDLMICLARSTSDTPGSSHQDLIGGRIARDHRLGDAELVDPAVDRAQRLLDDLVAERAPAPGGRRNVWRAVRGGPLDTSSADSIRRRVSAPASSLTPSTRNSVALATRPRRTRTPASVSAVRSRSAAACVCSRSAASSS